MERRKQGITKPSTLPEDYLNMVSEVFTANFDAGLKELSKIKGQPARFSVAGEIHSDEIILAVSLMHEGELAATTVYASADFDPKASSPTAQDLLAACVDGIGAIFAQLLSAERPENLEQLASQSLSAFEGVPFNWMETEIERFRVHVKVDKANPQLDRMADEWLQKNDPEALRRLEEEQKKMEDLFITGPRGDSKAGGKGPGNSLH